MAPGHPSSLSLPACYPICSLPCQGYVAVERCPRNAQALADLGDGHLAVCVQGLSHPYLGRIRPERPSATVFATGPCCRQARRRTCLKQSPLELCQRRKPMEDECPGRG